MSRQMTIALCLTLPLAAAGCARLGMRPHADEASPSTAATSQPADQAAPPIQPAPTEPVNGPTPLQQLRKADFQGWHLTVLIDGQETRPAYLEGERQIWTVEPVSTTPKVEFVTNRPYLGAFQQARLSVHAIHSGQVRVDELWQAPDDVRLAPLSSITLSRLRRVSDGDITDYAALPPGRYRLTLHVRGENTWDRQYIDLTVK